MCPCPLSLPPAWTNTFNEQYFKALLARQQSSGAGAGDGSGTAVHKAFEPVAYFKSPMATPGTAPPAAVVVARLPRPTLARFVTIKFVNVMGGSSVVVTSIQAHGLHSLHPLGPYSSTVFADRVTDMVATLKQLAAASGAGAGAGAGGAGGGGSADWTLERDVQVGSWGLVLVRGFEKGLFLRLLVCAWT